MLIYSNLKKKKQKKKTNKDIFFESSKFHVSCIVLYHFKKEKHIGGENNVLDYDIMVGEFEPYSCYYVHFWINTLWKDMEFLPLSVQGMSYIVAVGSFNKDALSLK